LTVDRVFARKGDGTVSLSGKMGLEGVLDMVVVADKISIRDTEGLGDRLPDIRGSFGLTGTVKGIVASPRADLDVVLTALAYKGNPIDSLEPLAKAQVPVLLVVGDADDVVPVAENSAIVEERYKKLGGPITVIHKPGVGHHPHSLKDPCRFPIIISLVQVD